MRRERETLGWLAQFSTRHADELRRLQLREADSRREFRIRDFRAAISAEGGLSLPRFTAKRPQGDCRGERGSVVRVRRLSEADWDPDEHPRVPKGQTGGGQWVDKDGGSGVARSRGKRLTVRTAIYSGPKKPQVNPVGEPVGHHWVNLTSAFATDVRQFLGVGAAEYAAGITSGALDPPHNNRPMNGVRHKDYSASVKVELKRFIELNNITVDNKMTIAQMEEFARLVENGRGADGELNETIAKFNAGIKATIIKGVRLPQTADEVRKIGRRVMKERGFQRVMAGITLSSAAGQLLADDAGLLNVAANSNHYKDAIDALHTGDLDMAQRLLIGDNDSFCLDLVGKVNSVAIRNFKDKMQDAFTEASARKHE